jgi:hypothetical protein
MTHLLRAGIKHSLVAEGGERTMEAGVVSARNQDLSLESHPTQNLGDALVFSHEAVSLLYT